MSLKTRQLAFILLFHAAAFAQPIANFTANPVAGCSPLVVNLFDQSSGNPTSWKWDLGNGTISYLQNPSVTYFTPGRYSVSLTVSNASGTNTLVKQQFITVYEQPTANFEASLTSGCFPLPIHFSDSSQVPNGNISQWIWDFGDGNFSTQPNPNHTYLAAGDYHVSIKVTSNQGCTKSITKPYYIKIFDGVNANFVNSTQTTCTAPANINFTNTSNSSSSMSYLWSFGDGQTSNDINPSHTFINNSNYTVRLIVTNSFGCKDTITKANAIQLGTVQANFSISQPSCSNASVLLTNTSSPAPVSAIWSYGDGVLDSNINGAHQYAQAGTYFISMVSNFGACTDTMVKSVSIHAATQPAFSSNDTLSCSAPFVVRFNNQTAGSNSYFWDFGDGSTSTDMHPVHTYTREGSYSVRLKVTNAYGCVDSLIRDSFINIKFPAANILNLPREGCAPFNVTFGASISSIQNIATYFWDFGDGTTSTQAIPSHTYDSGRYTVKLIITTTGGCVDTVIVRNAVKVGKIPAADFMANPLISCANQPINFFDQTPDTLTRWMWLFGDGGSSTIQNPVYTYTDTGFFDVTLIAYNNGCSDTMVKEDYIYINPPIAKIAVTMNCSNKFRRIFKGSHSLGADSYFWDFGDGDTSNVANPVHDYANTGSYVVSLRVKNNRTGCESVRTKSIIIANEFADFNTSALDACKYAAINLTAIQSSQRYISDFVWHIGDSMYQGPSISNTFLQSGTYNITLVITDTVGCKDSITKPNLIHIYGPTASFSASAPGICALSSVNFIDSSRADGTNPIVSWNWNFGDGSLGNYSAGPFAHHYSTPGTYSVSLMVTDSIGCTDMKAINNILKVSKPRANFQSPDSLSCPGKSINFVNRSTGPNLRFVWNFGDGSFSNETNPVHSYSVDGNYAVQLNIIDRYGCTDSIIKSDYIKIRTGIASFNMSDSIGNCPPLVVTFTNTSTNCTSYSWDFGDGTSSQLINPAHFYPVAGTYIIKLTAKSRGGCISTAEKQIIVKGPSGRFTYSPLEGCRPLSVSFHASTKNCDNIIWDFNDGNTLTTTDSIVTHVYDIPGKYRPKMIMTNHDGCQVALRGQDTIRVHGSSPAFDFNHAVKCDQADVVFSNSTQSQDRITSYKWYFGDGDSSSVATPTHHYRTPGSYQPMLIVNTSSSCSDTLKSLDPVRISASPVPTITRSDNGCVPVMIQFSGNNNTVDTAAVTWTWTFGDGRTSQLKDPGQLLYSNAGNYPAVLNITNSLGCGNSTSTLISAYALPVVDAGLDTINCYRKGVSLRAGGADRYEWQSASGLSCLQCANPIVNPDSVTTYQVTGYTRYGCSSKDSVRVNVIYPFELTASRNDSICQGENVLMYASGASTYAWSPSVNFLNSNHSYVSANPTDNTTFFVTGTDAHRCFQVTKEIPVRVFPIPTVEAGADLTISAGRSIELTPVISSDVNNVIWSPTSGTFRNSYPSITVKPRETTEYTVEVSNAGGCTAKDKVTVFVTCDGANIFIPNTFSPNADGMNDIFYPRGSGIFSIRSMKLFNRWGELIYEKSNFKPNDIQSGWDGTYRRKALNPDVYVYVVEVMCDNNTPLIFKGNVTLVK